MSVTALAQRSAVPLATVKRLLRDPLGVRYGYVRRVAETLGLSVEPSIAEAAEDVLRRAAMKKAKRIMSGVQGSSALEAQAVDQDTYRQMVDQAADELMRGSRRTLWAP